MDNDYLNYGTKYGTGLKLWFWVSCSHLKKKHIFILFCVTISACLALIGRVNHI